MKTTTRSKLDYSVIRSVIRSSPYQKTLHQASVNNDLNLLVSKLNDIYKRLHTPIPPKPGSADASEAEHTTADLPQNSASTLAPPAPIPTETAPNGSPFPGAYSAEERYDEGVKDSSEENQPREDRDGKVHTYAATFYINDDEETGQPSGTQPSSVRTPASTQSSRKPRARSSLRGHSQSPPWIRKNKV